MPCVNCQAKHLKLNRDIGLPVCQECGCIQAYRIVEIGRLTQFRNVKTSELQLLCNQFNINDIDEVNKNHEHISKTTLYQGYDLAERACAILYYTMSDLNKPVVLREFCKFLGCNTAKTSRLSKKIARYFSNAGVFSLNDIDEFLSNYEISNQEVAKACKDWEEQETLTRGIIAAFVYVHTPYTQKEVCEKFGISLPRLKRNIKKVKK